MIKFFRHIRRRLLSESKFNNYLLYGLGEIILVVIGILIALQINNWNERKKEKTKEAELLTQVLENLKQDSATIDSVLYMRAKIMEVHKQVIHYTKGTMDSSEVGNIDLLRRSFAEKLIAKYNNPNLSNEVLDKEIKIKVMDYYRAIDFAEFVMANNNELIEKSIRPLLAKKNLLLYGNQLDDISDEQFKLINRAKFFEEVRKDDLQQSLFESGIKINALINWKTRTGLENEKLSAAIKAYLKR